MLVFFTTHFIFSSGSLHDEFALICKLHQFDFIGLCIVSLLNASLRLLLIVSALLAGCLISAHISVGSLSRECVYGSLRRKRHVRSLDAWSETR